MFKWWLRDKLVNLRDDVRRAWLSLTIWFNGVVGGITGALLLVPVDQILAIMPHLRPYLSSEVFRKAMLILIVYNAISIALRFKTNKPLRHK